ncbi:MAG: Holliday junction resolvase RuvX [Fidelibacterota bacterium]
MGRILGIDYGSKRVGLAISDANQTIASPYITISTSDLNELLRELAGIVEAEEVKQIVIGLPIGLKGGHTEQTNEIISFTDTIRKQFAVKVINFDERLTSIQAKRALMSVGKKPSLERDLVNKTAAAIMLQAFLDSRK